MTGVLGVSRRAGRGPLAGPPARLSLPEEVLVARRLAALGLRGVRAVRVTDNRTVMVSRSPQGVLSIHRGFARAPDRVLRAVVRFVTPGTRRETRRAAEHEIRSFPAEAFAPGPPRRARSADRPLESDAARVDELMRRFAELNGRHFGGELPALPIRLSGRMTSRLGHLALRLGSGEPYEITISRRHLQRHGRDEVTETLLHEMVHLWQHRGGHPVDHGRAFRRKAREVGISPRANRSVVSAAGRRAARTDRP